VRGLMDSRRWDFAHGWFCNWPRSNSRTVRSAELLSLPLTACSTYNPSSDSRKRSISEV